MSLGGIRSELQHELLKWRDAGAPVSAVTVWIEALIDQKIQELLLPIESDAGVLAGLVGLVQLIAGRDDLPVGLKQTMLENHRYIDALQRLHDMEERT
jgi:hypothetical protein